MMNIKFGVSGLGPVNESIKNLHLYKQFGIDACEIAFTYGIYIKKQDCQKIKEQAKKSGIRLSIHAPYYINLNSKEPEKIISSKKRIIDCCEIGHLIGAKKIVFHSGFYSNMEKEVAFENIKNRIIEIQEIISRNKWDVELCPEIMGKRNVFGSIDEISRVASETRCAFTIDFAHVLARYDSHKFEDIKKAFPQKVWHCHFSGIEYSKEKGERRHFQTTEESWRELLIELKKINKKEITIISEAPNPFDDAILAKKIYNEMIN